MARSNREFGPSRECYSTVLVALEGKMKYIVIFKFNTIINLYLLSKIIQCLHTISFLGLLYS